MDERQSQHKYSEVELSNGQKVQVKRLGLFEIDDVTKGIPGPYTYTVHLFGGDDYEMVYNIEAALEDPPQKPGIPVDEAVPGLPEHYEWQEWLRFQEAVAHQTKMHEAYAEYCERVAVYVQEACLPPDTQIETVEDWEAIYNAALCPQVSQADIKAAMAQSFGATWGGREIFDALGNIEGGMGEYISTRVWEVELMVKLGETETAYTERGVNERARLIAALKIPEFFRILDGDRMAKEMRSKA